MMFILFWLLLFFAFFSFLSFCLFFLVCSIFWSTMNKAGKYRIVWSLTIPYSTTLTLWGSALCTMYNPPNHAALRLGPCSSCTVPYRTVRQGRLTAFTASIHGSDFYFRRISTVADSYCSIDYISCGKEVTRFKTP